MRTAKIGPDLRLEDEHPRPFQMGVLSLAYKPVEKKRFENGDRKTRNVNNGV